MEWHMFVNWVLITLMGVLVSVSLAKKLGNGVFFGLYAVMTVIANIIAVKLITIGEFVVPAAVLIYSLTFLLTDIVSEICGKDVAKKIVLTGFVTNVLAVFVIWLSIEWQSAPFVSVTFNDSFRDVLETVPRIVFASMVAYLISQTNDVLLFHKLREKTSGKHLWVRNNISTAISQLIDTTVFITIAFYASVPLAILFTMIKGQYIVKLLIAILDTPFCYLATKILKGET